MAGGVERVLTLKANYFADNYGYDITIILTEGKGKPFFYPLSSNIKVINLDLNFEELWGCSFFKKIFLYLKKQRRYRTLLSSELMRLKPDITISLLRREINFLNKINDGSKKIGEIHVNKANYRNFEKDETNFIKDLFSKFWMKSLSKNVRQLDKFVVLTEEDKLAWNNIQNVIVIPDPLTFTPTSVSPLQEKRVIAVGRYTYQKGFDLLLEAWSDVEKKCPGWSLHIFGQGDRAPYQMLIESLKIDKTRCFLNGSTPDILKEYVNSSLFVFPSRFEGFGMVLVEAMACGLPVISFDCPCGPKDIIKHNEDGILINNSDVQKLSEAMVSLMNDSSMRAFLAKNAHENVLRFNIDAIANRWKKLFESLV